MKRHITTAILALVMAQAASAQSGTNSPYSQFGLGEWADQSSGFNRGMNGLGIAFREGNQINSLNPASYSALDSITFLFDAGMSAQLTQFKDGSMSKNAKTANFEYVVAGFRLARHLGVSFGLLPMTNVGYNYSATHSVDGSTTHTTSYTGSGGLHQVLLGVGWEPLRGFSIGVNGGYVYGSLTRTVNNIFSNAAANTLTLNTNAEVRSYRFSGGVQYKAQLSKKDDLTLGVTYGLGHNIGGNPTLSIISYNPQTAVSDTASFPRSGSYHLSLPTEWGVGLSYGRGNTIRVGADWQLQQWAKVAHPVYTAGAATPEQTWSMRHDYYTNRQKFTLGGMYSPDRHGQSMLKRMQYRMGVSYATSYYRVEGQEGPREWSASVGVGIPIVNKYNNRSMLNISGQWVNRSATGLVSENIFRINIGLTFNESWFAKIKVD